MNLTNISEIKLLTLEADTSRSTIESSVNKILNEGWMLLDISTMAPEGLPGGSNGSRSNYYVYHFGKTEKIKKVEI